jgi:hypothetical protein
MFLEKIKTLFENNNKSNTQDMGESIASNGVAKIIDINDEMLKKN